MERNRDMIFYCGLKDQKVFVDSRKEIGTTKTKSMGQLKHSKKPSWPGVGGVRGKGLQVKTGQASSVPIMGAVWSRLVILFLVLMGRH